MAVAAATTGTVDASASPASRVGSAVLSGSKPAWAEPTRPADATRTCSNSLPRSASRTRSGRLVSVAAHDGRALRSRLSCSGAILRLGHAHPLRHSSSARKSCPARLVRPRGVHRSRSRLPGVDRFVAVTTTGVSSPRIPLRGLCACSCPSSSVRWSSNCCGERSPSTSSVRDAMGRCA